MSNLRYYCMVEILDVLTVHFDTKPTRSNEEGALIEPLNNAFVGIKRSGLKLGDLVLIAGTVPIAEFTLLATGAGGAEPFIITDLSRSGTSFSKEKKILPAIRTV
ncbi:hypothetical protein E3Q23_02344 [Wallemia mellicola]|uniref:Uncharacterized protein n=1 Tax=Wallemia mellicola TaxID=1708541 RepID=A0A4T0M0I0_9BASI|nr:hypothetical protein E3Q23_02344 [Wallemia mellicola]TIC64763.1 hypothetical protein E3Q01_02599 [Wallemia mellicola]